MEDTIAVGKFCGDPRYVLSCWWDAPFYVGHICINSHNSNACNVGRPGGPEFYISTLDNTANHGPGSQGSKTEADSCFGSFDGDPNAERIVKRMQKQPGAGKNGFVNGNANYIKIVSLHLRPTSDITDKVSNVY
jgi:hypothetical protein